MKKYISCSEIQTMEIASAIAKSISGGSVIALKGDLGTGKTIFAKGFAKGLNITQAITSPTFVIMNIYYGDKILYHYDMYRICNELEAEELGLTEYFGKSDGVCLIEWAENINSYLPPNCIRVEIKYISEDQREIIVQ